jgi:aryl-alcohol dehydrogenase-like predicted oxidoreductase
MEYRSLGRRGPKVSLLGFGCGDVGGLIVKGGPAERERAVRRALELGVNYFDTAASYGHGVSERHIGETLRAVKAQVVLGTKFRLPDDVEPRGIRAAITSALEASLGRLGMERVDLFQLHNLIGAASSGRVLTAADVLGEVLPTLDGLRQQGKIALFGITALGDTPSVHRVIDEGELDTAQVCYNLLNPTANHAVPRGFPGQDFGQLMRRTRERGTGVIVIRALAAGALSGSTARHPFAMPSVAPIASGPDFATDVQRAQALGALVREGHAGSLVEAALRFCAGAEAVSTVLLGYSSLEHLEAAAAAIEKGPLPAAAVERLPALWAGLAG